MKEGMWEEGVREGYRTKVIRIGNCIVTVHRPILSAGERRRREEQVETGLANLLARESEETKEEAS